MLDSYSAFNLEKLCIFKELVQHFYEICYLFW